MVEKRGKIISNENGVTYTINKYVDVQREYDHLTGEKKSKILSEYSEAKQRNIISNVLLEIIEKLELDSENTNALKVMKSFIDTI